MLVSHDWLQQYVSLPDDGEELAERLTMSGLNFEGLEVVGRDRKIDLEVTSNRSDCLGHIGIAREIAVLFKNTLRIPDPRPPQTGPDIERAFAVSIECPELCYRFTARLIRGVRIGPSPDWLVDRLATIGIESVNNIVDLSNYVMLECGQPLHAFDFDRLQGQRIIVREPRQDEQLVAINHSTYRLESGMCVIADAQRAIGLGGVMGGAETEVSQATTNILVEAAWFNPMAIRNTARKLNLHSAASFRFERTIDPDRIDWASRRCCDLILQLAGGELAQGSIDIGQSSNPGKPISFRPEQTGKVLGIGIPLVRIQEILEQLGFVVAETGDGLWSVISPSWRRDVTREIDLVEEVGRIHGYHHVPDNIPVRMAPTVRKHSGRVVDRVRNCLTAAGLDEAMTASLVPEKWCLAFSPWSTGPPLQSSQPMLGVLEKASQNTGPVHLLRQSLLPSLLEVFRINDHKQNIDINLFEIARVYLSRENALPDEPWLLGIVCEYSWEDLKGIVESILEYLNPAVLLDTRNCDIELLDLTRSAELMVNNKSFGWLGEVSEAAQGLFSIRRQACVAELDIRTLIDLAVPTVTHTEVSAYPAITRDFNFVVDDLIRWSDLSRSVHAAGGDLVESVAYRETFRDEQRDGVGKKRVLLEVVLRSHHGTLTREQADQTCEAIVRRCRKNHNAELSS